MVVPDDRGVEFTDRCGEGATGVALVVEDDLPSGSLGALQQLDPNLALVALGGAMAKALGVPSGAKRPWRRKPQKKRECDPHQP